MSRHATKWMQLLLERTGRYVGAGRNQEGEEFAAEMRLERLLDGRALRLHFRAEGIGGVVYHEEEGIIARATGDGLSLWKISSNSKRMCEYLFRPDESNPVPPALLVFRYGSPDNAESYREENRLVLMNEGFFRYQFFWGMPGGTFAQRSEAVMYSNAGVV